MALTCSGCVPSASPATMIVAFAGNRCTTWASAESTSLGRLTRVMAHCLKSAVSLDAAKLPTCPKGDRHDVITELAGIVIHIMNDGGQGTPYDVHAEIGQVQPSVAPVDGEPVVVKQAPNAFVGTDLDKYVDAAWRTDLVIAGFMTHRCVLFTAEGAFLRGNKPTVISDASATRSLRLPIADR